MAEYLRMSSYTYETQVQTYLQPIITPPEIFQEFLLTYFHTEAAKKDKKFTKASKQYI